MDYISGLSGYPILKVGGLKVNVTHLGIKAWR
jgi:hypothetical protein